MVKFESVDVLVCRRFGLSTFWSVDVLVCRRFGLSTFWSVDVLVCRRFGLSTFRFVDVSVCRRFGLSTFWLSTFRFVDVLTSNPSGGPAAQTAAARSHTSELTRGCFCFRVSTGGLRWVPQMSRASSGWPGAGKTKGSRGLSLSLHISGATDYAGTVN